MIICTSCVSGVSTFRLSSTRSRGSHANPSQRRIVTRDPSTEIAMSGGGVSPALSGHTIYVVPDNVLLVQFDGIRKEITPPGWIVVHPSYSSVVTGVDGVEGTEAVEGTDGVGDSNSDGVLTVIGPVVHPAPINTTVRARKATLIIDVFMWIQYCRCFNGHDSTFNESPTNLLDCNLTPRQDVSVPLGYTGSRRAGSQRSPPNAAHCISAALRSPDRLSPITISGIQTLRQQYTIIVL